MGRMAGITLIELVVALAIALILIAASAPSFRTVMTNARISAHANELISALNLARSEAVKRGRRVVLCKSGNGTACATSGDWSQGWIVFVDMDNNASVDAASGDSVIRVYQALDGNDTLTGDTNLSDYISYLPNGFTRLTGGGFQSGTLTFGLCSGNREKNTIVISNTGHARVVKTTCP